MLKIPKQRAKGQEQGGRSLGAAGGRSLRLSRPPGFVRRQAMNVRALLLASRRVWRGLVVRTTFAAMGLAVSSGCVALMPASDVDRLHTDLSVLEERVDQLQERVTAIQMEQQRLHADVEAARLAARQENPALRAQLEELQRQIVAVHAAREQDRRAIVDELSRKMAGILAGSGGGGGSRASGSTQTGYEHVVKSGETLSEIARAYKVGMDAIIKANNLPASGMIRVGQKLFIPESPSRR